MYLTKDRLEIKGSINNRDASVDVSFDAKKEITLIAKGLKITDLVPKAANVLLLGSFAFEKLHYSKPDIMVAGKINGRDVQVHKQTGKPGFTFTGSALTLSDFVPQVSAVPFLNTFAFESFNYAGDEWTVVGSVGKSRISVVRNLTTKTFNVTGTSLNLADFVPKSGKLTFLWY